MVAIMRDPYLYEDVEVLKNKLGIRVPEKLENAEAAITLSNLADVKKFEIGEFNLDKLKELHKHIFGDIYEWAGEFRKINIEKSEKILNGLSVEYSDCSKIDKEAKNVINKLNKVEWGKLNLDQAAETISKLTAELWKVHCFREGNTRTTIKFIELFTKSKGIEINGELLKNNPGYVRNSLVLSSINEYSEPENLIKIIKDSIQEFSIKEKIEKIYSNKNPEIKNISEKTAKMIDDLNKISSKILSLKEIKDIHNKLGKKIEGNYSNEDLQEFKKFNDIVDDLKQAKLKFKEELAHEKVIENPNISKSMELVE